MNKAITFGIIALVVISAVAVAFDVYKFNKIIDSCSCNEESKPQA